LRVYALAAREELGLDPQRLVYYNLQDNQAVVATRDAKLLQQVSGVVQEVAADIRAREFPPTPGFACKTCDYRFLCPAMEARRGAPADAAGAEDA
jgi:putative RecB family exonuclease